MKVKVIGREVVNYKDKKTGQPSQFGQLHCISDFPLDGTNEVAGKSVMIVSCNPDTLRKIPINVIANLDFNQRGHLVSIDIVEDAPADKYSVPFDEDEK